jgi:hypothetical protein
VPLSMGTVGRWEARRARHSTCPSHISTSTSTELLRVAYPSGITHEKCSSKEELRFLSMTWRPEPRSFPSHLLSRDG